MADTSVNVASGTGIAIDVFQRASGSVETQYVRRAQVTSVTQGSWTCSTTGTTSQIAASSDRVAAVFVNNGGATIYMRFDTTAPTLTTFQWRIDPFERYEVPADWAACAMNFIADSAQGTLLYALGTRA